MSQKSGDRIQRTVKLVQYFETSIDLASRLMNNNNNSVITNLISISVHSAFESPRSSLY
jgi:hypothetical protein